MALSSAKSWLDGILVGCRVSKPFPIQRTVIEAGFLRDDRDAKHRYFLSGCLLSRGQFSSDDDEVPGSKALCSDVFLVESAGLHIQKFGWIVLMIDSKREVCDFIAIWKSAENGILGQIPCRPRHLVIVKCHASPIAPVHLRTCNCFFPIWKGSLKLFWRILPTWSSQCNRWSGNMGQVGALNGFSDRCGVSDRLSQGLEHIRFAPDIVGILGVAVHFAGFTHDIEPGLERILAEIVAKLDEIA